MIDFHNFLWFSVMEWRLTAIYTEWTKCYVGPLLTAVRLHQTILVAFSNPVVRQTTSKLLESLFQQCNNVLRSQTSDDTTRPSIFEIKTILKQLSGMRFSWEILTEEICIKYHLKLILAFLLENTLCIKKVKQVELGARLIYLLTDFGMIAKVFSLLAE